MFCPTPGRTARVLCLSLVVLAGVHAARAQTPETPAIPVTTQRATLADVDVYEAGAGTMQAAQSALVRARVDGTIDRIAFTEGQDVAAGDVLASIDARPYAAVVAAAHAARDAAAARLANARRDLARLAGLANSPAASAQRSDAAASLVAELSAELRGDDAAIATAELNLSFCRITAPFAGVAGLRLIDAGNLVHASDVTGIVTIAQVMPINLLFTLPQQRLAAIRASLAAEIARVTVSTTDNPTPIATGTLLAASNAVDPATGTVALKAVFPNANRHLWPGELVTARLRLAVLAHSVTITPSSVQRGPDGLYVYVVGDDNLVARRDVKLAYQDDGIAAVSSGLAAGEQVIIAGQSRVAVGMRADPHPQPPPH